MCYRKLKKKIIALLYAQQWPDALAAIARYAPRQVANPLFGCLYHEEPLVRWRAVSAMGEVVAKLADEDMEAARIIMRRCMWNLNDESGGIGWGSPEAMGEIMSRHSGLAQEYGSILVSYADPNGNFLEHPGLQLGVLWAVGRIGRVYPHFMVSARDLIVPYLSAGASNLRGMALWALMPFVSGKLCGSVQLLIQDDADVTVYENETLKHFKISQLAESALTASLGGKAPDA
jgi:hypothetical protein